jgi:hypothetical protein
MNPQNLSQLWEEHVQHEFATHDTEETLATMRGRLRMWNLRAIRQELATLNLDWELPRVPAARQQPVGLRCCPRPENELMHRQKYTALNAKCSLRRGLRARS